MIELDSRIGPTLDRDDNMTQTNLVKLNLTRMLGLGGEGIILKKFVRIDDTDRDCAIRMVPVIEDTYNEFVKRSQNPGPIRASNSELVRGMTRIVTKNQGNTEISPKELAAFSLQHPNIIKFLDHAYEFIEDNLYHLTGKTTIGSP